MGQENALLWFFVLIIVVFAIALVVILVGLARSRRRVGGLGHGSPGIAESQQPVAKRLGEERPGQLGEDPRGDDIGGNFSTIPPEEENKR